MQVDRRSFLRGLAGPAAILGLDAMFTAERTNESSCNKGVTTRESLSNQ